MRTSALILTVVAAAATGCQYDQFRASRVEQFEIPASDIRALDCAVHNGKLIVRGGPDDVVRGHVELIAKGSSPEQAEQRLQLLERTEEIADGTLTLGTHWTDGGESGRSSDASYTLEIPARLALRLSSHNGEIDAQGLRGRATLSSHNGDIVARGLLPSLHATTHNGAIVAAFEGGGPADGQVSTHNGSVDVEIHTRDAHIVANTHRGGIDCSLDAAMRTSGSSYLEAKIGETGGRLTIATHNGSIRIY